MLDSSQINALVTSSIDPSLIKDYGGCLAQNQLPDEITVPYGCIIHSHDDDVKKGHWFCLYINADREGVWFCSFGIPPFGNAAKFLEKNCKYVTYNKRLIQHLATTTCGLHAVNVLIRLLKGNRFSHIMQLYGTDTSINDKRVFEAFKTRLKSFRV